MTLVNIHTEQELLEYLKGKFKLTKEGITKEEIYREMSNEKYSTYCFTSDTNFVESYVINPWVGPLVYVTWIFDGPEKNKLNIHKKTLWDAKPTDTIESLTIDCELKDRIVIFRKFNDIIHIPENAEKSLLYEVCRYASVNNYI